MSSTTSSDRRENATRPSRQPVWPGYLGGLLLLTAGYRWNVESRWDAWCTVLALLGSAGVAAWGWSHYAELQRRARLRGVRYGGQALLSSLFLLALLVMANFLVTRHNTSWDLTESRVNSLSPETVQVLRGLDRDIHLLAFYRSDKRAQAARLLQRYSQESPRLTYEFIDPDQDPDQAQRLGVTAYETVVVQAVRKPGEAQASGKPVRVEPEPTGGKVPALSEEKLTSALLKVTRGGAKTIYFVEGHGEADFDSPERNGYSRVRSALEGQAFTVKRLALGREKSVPSDCSLLVIAGPSTAPLPGEIAAIEKYLLQGGKAFVMLDPAPGVGLDAFLKGWGVVVRPDLVVDVSAAGRAYGAGPAVPLVKDYDGQHPITRGFRTNTMFPLARSVAPSDKPGDAQVWPLAQTSPESFAEPYTGGAKHARFDPAHDRKGPILLAVAVTRPAKEGKEARLVVTGDSDFISNAFFDSIGNGDFFLRSVNWLVQDESLIAIRPRPRQDRRVQFTEQEARSTFWMVVLLMPLAALAAGVWVQWKRR